MPVPQWHIQYYAYEGREVESSDIFMQWLPRQMSSARHHDFVSEGKYGLASALGGAQLCRAAAINPPIPTGPTCPAPGTAGPGRQPAGTQKSSSGWLTPGHRAS